MANHSDLTEGWGLQATASNSVVHAVGHFMPDSVGGSEIFVAGLAHHLNRIGIRSRILAPAEELKESQYRWEGLDVHRYPWSHAGEQEIIAGARPPYGMGEFLRELDRSGAAIYHQHSWTGGCGPHHLRAAHERGMRTVTTVHVPGFFCVSGGMMLDGRRPCDGRVEAYRCGKCWAHTSRNVPRPLAGAATCLSRAADSLLGHDSRLARIVQVTDRQRERLEILDRCSDRIVVVCQWLHDALRLNGIAEDKLVLCRQGTDLQPPEGLPPPPRRSHEPFRVGFLGRYDPLKGLEILIRAVLMLPADTPLELHIHGLANGPREIAYAGYLEQLAHGDSRIMFMPSLERGGILQALAGFDVLAIPSQWLETGPLVALEALAARVPILGSDLGGIAELVRQGADGWLVRHDSPSAWAGHLERLSEGRDFLSCAGEPEKVRTMVDVAGDMSDIYARLRTAPRTNAAAR